MKPGLLFLNGKKPSDKLLKSIDFKGSFVICADGAYKYVKKFAEPDILLGDFDSLDIEKESIPKSVKIVRYSSEKDYTDGFLAVQEAASAGVTSLKIYGSFGGRADHEFNNYTYLSLCAFLSIDAVICGDQFDVLLTETQVKFSTSPGKIVSIVPFSDSVHILQTKGLKYPADGLIFSRIQPHKAVDGISNAAINTSVEIKIKNGKALVFIEK